MVMEKVKRIIVKQYGYAVVEKDKGIMIYIDNILVIYSRKYKADERVRRYNKHFGKGRFKVMKVVIKNY